MKDRLAESVFWITWSRGVGLLVSFLSSLVVARLLSPADYGLMAMAGIWTGIMSLISEMGMGAAIVQFQELEDDELNSCFWLTMSLAALGYLALYFAAPLLETWFSTPMLANVVRVVALTLPLIAIRVVPDGLLRKQLAFDKLSQADLVSTLLTVPVVLGMAWAGGGVWALVAGTLVAPAVQNVVIFRFAKWFPGIRIGGKRFRELMRYSLATLVSRVSWATYQQADIFVLGKVSGDVTLGFYSMAKELAALPVTRISTVVNQLASPVMAELQVNREALRAALLRALRLTMAVSLPLCAGLILEAEDFVRVLLTEKWTPSVPILRILCLYSMLSSVAALFVPLLMARYRIKFVFRYTLLQLLVMPIAFLAGAAWLGAVGVALAWAVIYPLGFAWLVREVVRELDIPWTVFLLQFRPAVVATAIMAAVVLLFQVEWSSLVAGQIAARLTVSVLVGAIGYSTALWFLGGPVRSEVIEVAGWVMRGRRAVGAGRVS